MSVYEIPFTQYLLPDGRQKPVTVGVEDEAAVAARALVESGVRFEVEILRDGLIWLTAVREDDEGETVLLASQLCSNGPAVHDAVAVLVRAAAGQEEGDEA